MYKNNIEYIVGCLTEITINNIILELGLDKTKLEQMQIAQILKELGYKKKRIYKKRKCVVVWYLSTN